MSARLTVLLLGAFVRLAAVAAVESVPVPELPDVAASGEIFAAVDKRQACVWDFTDGKVPDGGSPGKAAVIGVSGLVATNLIGKTVQSGFWLQDFFTPAGAFVLVADFIGGGSGEKRERVLWDDMAVTYPSRATNRGFQLAFAVDGETWTPVFYAGNGSSTASCRGPRATVRKGERMRIRVGFTADGRVVWDFGGKKTEADLAFDGPLAPSRVYRPVIGDRAVSNYQPFDGIIRRLAIAPAPMPEVSLRQVGRTAFRRDEKEASVSFEVANLTGGAIRAARALVEQFAPSGRIRSEEFGIGDLAAGERRTLSFPVEPRVTPGWHPLRVTVSGTGDKGAFSRAFVRRVGSGPVLGDRLPVLMWGFSSPTAELADLGFTHGLVYTRKIGPRISGFDPEPDLRQLDEALVDGIGLTRSARVQYPNENEADASPDIYMRRTRENESVRHGAAKRTVPEVSHPEMAPYFSRLATDDAQVFGGHPAFSGMLPCSESRDGTSPSFNTEHLRYRRETGRDVPDEVVGSRLNASQLKAMRARYPDGLVPDDDPVLSYYRWFWSGGDGWPAYTGALAEAYRKVVRRPDFFVFWDPAVRCPPRWGSGGSVDLLNQWVYAVPEPMNVAGPSEELFAMAAGRPGQKVAVMTQLICYRSRVAPKDRKVSPEPAWVGRRPNADFPTIAPDSLQEATWSMLAKPVQAIMYHGWGTICETGAEKGYVYTNPESRERLSGLLKDIVRPLGPMLKRLGRAPQPVAVLESFTTAVFGGPASYGWSAPAVTFLQRARLDPRVVYEETILRDGLADAKVLYLPQCLFLTPAVLDKIAAFRRNGGLVIADGQCLSALKSDLMVPVVSFDPVPEADLAADIDALEARREGDARTRAATMRAKAKMIAQAADLRQKLAGRYSPAVDSSSPEIVTYARSDGRADYVFAINDNRTFGDYFGPWGLTMEKGLPTAGWISMAEGGEPVRAVYELSKGGKVAFKREPGRIIVPVEFQTNDGRLFAFLKDEIERVDVAVSVTDGKRVRVRMAVVDRSGRPVRALLPVDIRLYDAQCREVDGSGPAAATDGVCEVDILTNVDDAKGAYRLVCKDRASGLSKEVEVRMDSCGHAR